MHDSSRILLVEDDDALRADLEMVLSSEGYTVVACASGLDAIDQASRAEFDMVVSDIRMPGLDGLETLERLQERPRPMATLVITGYTDEADSIRAVRLGVGDYIKKPFGLEEFLQAVERQLALHRARVARDVREKNWQSLGVWSLEELLKTVNPEPAAPLLGARRAELTAEEMGATPELSAQARVAVLLSACLDARRSLEGSRLPAEFLRTQEEVRLETSESEDLSLLAQVAQLARGAQPQGVLEQAWKRAGERTSRAESRSHDEGPSTRLLLQKARAHEQARQLTEAAAGFTQVAQGSEPRERIEALLGLARIYRTEPDRSRQFALDAVVAAEALGPLLGGATCLQAGIQLSRVGFREEARKAFERAHRIARELRHGLLEAQAALALVGVGVSIPPAELERCWQELLRPENRFDWADSAWWAASPLLRLQITAPTPSQDRLLTLIARDSPTTLIRIASDSNSEAPLRIGALSALAHSAHPSATEAFRQLSADPDPAVRQAANRTPAAAAAAVATPPILRVYTLGALEIYRGEERISDSVFRSWKQRYLFARLLLSGERAVASDRLVDEFWPDDAEKGRNSLNVGISHLRKLLRPPNWPKELEYVLRDSGGVRLNPELPIWEDCSELVRLATPDAEPTDPNITQWERAVDLYRGPYLDSCYMEWAVHRRSEVEALVQRTLRRLLDVLFEKNRYAEMLEYGNRLVLLDGWSQDGHLAVMRANTALGRPEAAIRQFETCKKILMRELQAEPSIAMLEAYQRARLAM